jgi:hypothetical protein
MFYDKDHPGTVWDFECPLCEAQWNNEGDPIPEGKEACEQCPNTKCSAELLVTASWSVDYELRVDEKVA